MEDAVPCASKDDPILAPFRARIRANQAIAVKGKFIIGTAGRPELHQRPGRPLSTD